MKLVLTKVWLQKMLNTVTTLKVDEVEVDIVDGVPYSKVEGGKVVAAWPGKAAPKPKEKAKPKEKDKKEKTSAGEYPVWRVDEKLVSEGKGKPELFISELDEANAMLIANELGLETPGELADIKKAIWTAIYGD